MRAPPGGGGYPFASAAVRWLVYLGALAAVGGYIFRALVLSAARLVPEAAAIAARRWSMLVWWWLGLAALASAVALVVQAAEATGNPWSPTVEPPVFAVAAGTAWGHVWLARMAFIGGLMAVTALLGSRTAPRRLSGLLMGAGVALGLGLLASLSLASHAAAGSLRLLGIGADFVHLVAGATWVGGIIALVVVALPTARALDAGERRGYLIGVVARFSSVALASAFLLVATGAVSAWLRVGSWGALGGTQYGLTLIAKLTLIGGLLLAAATNLLYVRPRLEQGSSLDAGRLLRRLVVVEAGVGVAVLLATGALTALQPGRDAWARMERPLTLERTAGDLTVRLVVDPARLGANSYTATLTDARGRLVTNAEAGLRLTFLGADVAAQEVALLSAGEGRYQAQGAELSLRGLWQALVAVQRPGDFDTQAVFRFLMPPTPLGDSETRLPRLRPTLGRRTILGLEIAVAGLVLLAIGWRLRGWALQAGALVAVAGLSVAAFGGFLAGRAQVAPEAPALAAQVNPVAPDMQSLQVGRLLYEGQCTVCHGAAGHGDGPQAAGLTPPPLDLTVHVPLHPDGELFGFVV
ncbi:MAG: CopD family protein [Chloroflexi bacterium]|nr:CopD family protein [Chloroflexota bacterium]